jgi:hypothetical protein
MIRWLGILNTSVFEGFAFFVLIALIAMRKPGKTRELFSELMDVAVTIIRINSLVFVPLWALTIYESSQNDEQYQSLLNRMMGPYWLAYWMYIFFYGVFPQLLWLKKLKRNKILLAILALLLMFALYVERWVIILTTLHRDYLPGSWLLIPQYLRLDKWALSIFTFAFVLGLVYFVKNQLHEAKRET